MTIQTNFYTITPYNNLLHLEMNAAWDERVAIDFRTDTAKIISEYYQYKTWGMLTDRREWELNTPEAERVFTEAAKTAITKTLTHCAIIIKDSELKKWQIKNMLSEAKHYQTKIFKDFEEAKIWLTSVGYEMNLLI